MESEPEWLTSSDSAGELPDALHPEPITGAFIARVRPDDWCEEGDRRTPQLPDSSDDGKPGVIVLAAESASEADDLQLLTDPAVALRARRSTTRIGFTRTTAAKVRGTRPAFAATRCAQSFGAESPAHNGC
jgi:hypothetical protein